MDGSGEGPPVWGASVSASGGGGGMRGAGAAVDDDAGGWVWASVLACEGGSVIAVRSAMRVL